MGRPKGSKNKVKTTDEVVQIGGDPPPLNEGPPDRLAEHQAAQLAAEQASVKALFDNRTVVHQAVEDAAERYNEIKLKRSTLSKDEKAAREHLHLKMAGHKLTRYKTKDGWTVLVQNDEKVITERNDGDSVEIVTHSGAINPSGGDESMLDEDLDIDAPIEGEEMIGGESAA